jgi:nucleoside-diphosphate-sugar epimerase
MVLSPKNLVLITGVTGHVGFRTLIQALQAGYWVRAAVRSHSKAQAILSHPKIQALNAGQRLTFTIVPDLACLSAYDEAVEGVRYIIHIASPLMMGKLPPGKDEHAYFIRPAVRGTIGMLKAAKKCGTVRRVVITSSLVALVPLAQLTGDEWTDRPVQPTDRIEFTEGPYETEFAAYASSKVAALSAAENWIRTQKPQFDVIHLHPSFVQGRNDLAAHTRDAIKGTNSIILGMALGKKMGSIASASVHNDDVARVHVQALNPIIPGNQSYILSQETQWSDVLDIVEAEFPEAVQARILPNCGQSDTHEVIIDASLTEEIFGFQHLGLYEQVQSVVGHYLELRSRRMLVSEPAMSAMESYTQVRVGA